MTSAPFSSSLELVVLHALRCVGATSLARLAAAARLAPADVESVLIDLAVDRLVTFFRGPFGGWAITDEGRAEDARQIAAELHQAGARPAVERAYVTFLGANPDVLDVCTAWQLRPVGGMTRANDHTDHRYDDRVLKRLAGLNDRIQDMCTQLAGSMDRFTPYGPRLGHAVAGALVGDSALITESTDSFHAVWFQLHEDLLTTLGIPRQH